MRVSEVMKKVYLSEGNAPCELKVESEQWKIVFGHLYGNEFMRWLGVNGRVNDIPAYVGDCEVLYHEQRADGGHVVYI